MKKPGKMLAEVLRHIGRKPATLLYPAERPEIPARFRGKLNFTSEKCIGCRLCVKDCPTGAIEIKKVGDKKFECYIDLDKCIYCAQCVDSCAKKALEVTGEFELAQLDRGKLKLSFHVDPDGQPPTGA